MGTGLRLTSAGCWLAVKAAVTMTMGDGWSKTVFVEFKGVAEDHDQTPRIMTKASSTGQ